MRGLVDRGHQALAAVGGEGGDHHCGVGKRHQRLTADDAADAAQPFGERHAQHGTRLPVRYVMRRIKVEPFDRQIEILHPWRKYLAKHPPCFADAEFFGLFLLLHVSSPV